MEKLEFGNRKWNYSMKLKWKKIWKFAVICNLQSYPHFICHILSRFALYFQPQPILILIGLHTTHSISAFVLKLSHKISSSRENAKNRNYKFSPKQLFQNSCLFPILLPYYSYSNIPLIPFHLSFKCPPHVVWAPPYLSENFGLHSRPLPTYGTAGPISLGNYWI